MIISGLDFGLILVITGLVGIGSGISVVVKCRDNIMIRSRSRGNSSPPSHNGTAQIATHIIPSTHVPYPSAPAPTVTKITLE